MVLPIFGTSNQHAIWQPDPDGRGTSSLLQTCLITIGLCIYSAIHLNIPRHGASWWEKFFAKLKWVVVALFAPELVVFTAWCQRQDAKVMLKALVGAHGGRVRPPLYKRLWRWLRKGNRKVKYSTMSEEKARQNGGPEYSLANGFYFVMGGLTFDDSISFERIFPPGLDRLTLHPKFILWCLEKDSNIIPRITESEIYDKNKANSLAKAFACLQALWFCLQFVTRMAQKLPVSLLELNTFAHSICALLIYLLWWEKPMDIDEASTLATSQSPRIRSLAAWATVRSQLDFYEVLRPGMKSWQTFQQFCDLQFFDRSAADTQARLRWPLFDRLSSPSSSFQDDILPRPAFCGLDLDREGGRFQYVSYEPIVLYLRQGMRVPGTSFYVRAQSCEVDASLAARLKESARIDNNDPEESQETSPRLGTNSLVMELANWPRDRLKSSKSFYGLLFFSQVLKVSREQTVALLLTGLCYGGLHALAFGAPLRSRAETLCWEISCLTIACYGPVIVLLDLLSTVEFICNPLRVKINSQDLLSGAFIVLNALVVYAGLVLYVLSRVYLVIEIFLSLPYVDTGVYQTPNWSVYFPHIG